MSGEHSLRYEKRTERARDLVAALHLPHPLTAELLHRHMEGLRGKTIVIRPASTRLVESGVCGLWIEVAGENFERIHHAPTDSAVHRQQFINHEFGHMILRHEKELLPIERVALLAPLIPLDAIAYALSRSSFTDDQEALAEAIGDRLALIMLEDEADAAKGPQTGFGRVL
ncbi:hypothetical protein E3T37_10070 [Cryobacterium sp. TMT2-10]|uniref:ImmA/IrrE family metallo-endopeptidase n=1 Tax=Cryobacterium shii TaxID=1259235 RepID=A0AAQ2C804_9MICO|nr:MULTISPECIES: hypothetical protein [Cryobacterium]TFC51618.1 hypothetical protein E3O49_02970 [Cryobacterium shii]TFD27142.1 hypothetical protein E3T32_02485 [Cryobacterium sp. TMT2-23]TFD38220.1 hypothetical protein E3T37_10070 [Cryobacterium sp. TMT2-10]